MKAEVFVLNNKIIFNFPNAEIAQQVINKLKQLGIEVSVEVPDSRCG